VAASILVAAPLRAQEPESVTLDLAVRTALAQNARIVNQRDAVEQAALFRHAAGDAFRPKLVPNVQGSLGQTDASAQMYRFDFLQRMTTGTEVRAGFGASSAQIPSAGGEDVRFYNTDTSLTLVQPLLRGLGRAVARRGLTTAEVRHEDAQAMLDRTEQLLAIDVAAAFFRVLEQQTLRDVSTKSVERSEQLLQMAEAKLKAGLVSQLDVLRARQLVAESRLQLEDARFAVESARDDLGVLMGRTPASGPFDVVGDIPPPMAAPSAEEALAIARGARTDLQRASAGIDEADRAVGYFRNQLLPQVDLSVGLARHETAPTLSDSIRTGRFKVAAFFTVSMPIDRTPQLVDYQSAVIDRDRRRRDAEILEQAVGTEVKRTVRDVRRLTEVLDAVSAGVALAREEVEIANFRYARGLSSSLEVTTAEAGLLAAEGRRISAAADAALAGFRLKGVMGVLNPARDFAEPARTPARLARREVVP
jgi:outer membrane protein TolC